MGKGNMHKFALMAHECHVVSPTNHKLGVG